MLKISNRRGESKSRGKLVKTLKINKLLGQILKSPKVEREARELRPALVSKFNKGFSEGKEDDEHARMETEEVTLSVAVREVEEQVKKEEMGRAQTLKLESDSHAKAGTAPLIPRFEERTEKGQTTRSFMLKNFNLYFSPIIMLNLMSALLIFSMPTIT